MNLYIVVKRGVYIHEIYGIDIEIEDAKKKARELASKEPDDYHVFEVLEIENGVLEYDGNHKAECVVYRVTKEKEI